MLPVTKRYGVADGIDGCDLAMDEFQSVVLIMILRSAQIGTFLAHLPGKKIRDGHPRVWRLGLRANQCDFTVRIELPKMLGRRNCGRPCARNDIVHGSLPWLIGPTPGDRVITGSLRSRGTAS